MSVDSLPPPLTAKHNIMLRNYLKTVDVTHREWRMEKLPSPQQKDSYACGLMTVCRALDYLEGTPFHQGLTDPIAMAALVKDIITTRYLPMPVEAIMTYNPRVARIHRDNDPTIKNKMTMTSTDQVLQLMKTNGMPPRLIYW